MRILSKRWMPAVVVAFCVVLPAPGVQAQPSSPPLSSHLSSSPSTDADGQPPIPGDTENVANDNFSTPIMPDWIEEPTYEKTVISLDPAETADWTPTDSPNSTLAAGQMRSDREEIPGDFTKEEADLAEMKEAQLTGVNSPIMNAAAGCRVYWPSPYEVCGAIRSLYDSLGGPRSFLTFPKSRELTNPDDVGKRSEFVNGFIYWHPHTGAHTVSTPASVVWGRNGWETGHFGYPTTSDIALGNQWFKQHYQGGYIYTHNSLPVIQAGIQGRIYDKWTEMGARNSVLGYPIDSEETMPDGVGKYNLFQRGIMIWHPQYGARAITGDILLQWVYSGIVSEPVGYPTGDPVDFQEGWKQQTFEKAPIRGMQLGRYFPKMNPNAGQELDLPTLQAAGPAGGNDYTDQVLLNTTDKCGEPIMLRRGWYNASANRSGPWGYDKIVHKHGIWSLWSIKTVLQNSCVNRQEGDDAVYEEMVYEVKCSDPYCAVYRPTGESFQYRAIEETTIWINNASEPRGVKTLFPVHKTGTHGESDVAPEWFSTGIPTLNLWRN